MRRISPCSGRSVPARRTTVADGLVGVLGAIVSGSLLAVAVAVSLSPLSPLGPIRAVYHRPESRSTGRSWASGSSC